MFLRGDRDYVQGTQIVARAAEILPDGTWSLASAKFSRITRNLVTFQTEAAEDAIAVVQFTSGSGETADVHVRETETAAPRRDIAMDVQCHRDPAAAEDPATYRFFDARSFEDGLNAFVIALKAEHVRRFGGARDIWFTGLRGGRLPVSDPLGEGSLTLTLMRQLEGTPAHQTLWRCTAQDRGGHVTAQGAITFSFVPGVS